ncbi:NmrA family protein [Acrocarpospora pleiomorpha]|uniref:NmrA family protein n=1 Tax=Acrocarpospora pleiomorpha TaxID=90975 RepID=A0A5M3XKL4_9ACTN|nr:NmrA family NAD(P)-binding protein [Acrocarpospora pleiomorpha]GES20689.1 NmrA family protein [Acrocarpospora pleiomorpha]
MTPYTVTVFGATGKTGRHVTRQAATMGWRVRTAGRSPSGHGEWVRFEWDDEDTWTLASSGSDAAYFVIPYSHPGAPEKAPRLLETIAAAGVDTIVLLSTLDAENAPDTDPSRAAELALESLPVTSAILRPTWFMDNFTAGSFAAMTDAGEIRLPAGDGRIPFVDARDVAAVAVAALRRGGPSGVLPITGPEQLSHHDVARALTQGLGRPVRYTPVEPAEFIDLMISKGFSRDYGLFLAEALSDVASGRLRIPVTDTVARTTGRAPYTIEEFARTRSTMG